MMKIKNALMALAVVALMWSCNNTGQKNAAEQSDSVANGEVASADTAVGVIEYASTVYDFGTVKEGAVVDHIFKFKNTGAAPVILSQVSASCGCTTPDYTSEPILPGKEGEIKVSFNSLGQVGNQQKIVTVSSNAENKITTVQIKGIVEK